MDSVFITAFIMGIMGSVHCIGMCGSVVGILSSNLSLEVRSNPQKLALFQLTYNIGRISIYILMGVVFASFSYLLAEAINMGFFEKTLRIFASVMMILIGLFIAGFANFLNIFEKLGQNLWQKLNKFSHKFIPVDSYKKAFLFGIFWGNIPCGLVYSALALTLTTTPINGGMIMLFFGLGTLPSMLAIAGFGFFIIRFLQKDIVKIVAGIIIILLGISSLSMPLMHSSNMHIHS